MTIEILHSIFTWLAIIGIFNKEKLWSLWVKKNQVNRGQFVDIPRGALHRIENIGKENISFIEIQTGDYFGEDDIATF